MKKLLLVAAIFCLAGCGKEEVRVQSPESCHVEETEYGAIIECDDGTTAVIEDGTDGVDGEDSVGEIVDPCGDYPGHFDELLLVTSAGDIIAYFKENGSREFLTLLTPGQYQTTDRQKCDFEVESDGTIIW